MIDIANTKKGEEDFINYDSKNGVTIITLNRPERLNALGTIVIAQLQTALQHFENDSVTRVAIITGKGRAFSAGNDIKEMAETSSPGRQSKQENKPLTYGLSDVTKPTIVAVNGLALGGGCHLALEADIRIASENASFSVPEINLCLYGANHALVLQGIPICVVMEMSLTGERISAKRAYEIGLINRVVPEEVLMEEAMKVAQLIAQQSPLALALTKKAIIKAASLQEDVLSFAAFVDQQLRASEDAAEGVTAFAQKRKPVFKGK